MTVVPGSHLLRGLLQVHILNSLWVTESSLYKQAMTQKASAAICWPSIQCYSVSTSSAESSGMNIEKDFFLIHRSNFNVQVFS